LLCPVRLVSTPKAITCEGYGRGPLTGKALPPVRDVSVLSE